MDKSVLKKALADSPDPTPGYLFRDITQMTFGDQATQAKLVAYLNDKLAPKNSVHVLAKTLKVIKVLCETGHTDFQKEFQRQSDFLKQFAQYRGPQDAKFGDAYNERVRTNAKEAIDAAFSPRKESRIGSMAGHGSDATTTAHDSGSSKGFVTGQAIGTAPGTGAHCAPMPTSNKWAEHMATKNQPTGSSSTGAAKNVKEMVSTGFGLWKEGVKSDEDRMREAGHSTVGEFRAVEIPVAGFGGDSGFGGGGGGGGSSDGGWKFTEDTSAASAALPAVQEARMLTALQKEVERIVAFKNSPQRVDLTHFLENTTAAVARAGTWEDLAEALDAKLAQSVPWQQRLNALCCIEHLVRNKVGADFDAYFVSNPEDVQRNVFVVQSSLKEKASKVLKMLGIPDKSTAPKAAAPTAAAPTTTGGGGATTTTNFDGNVTWGSAQPEPAAAPAGSDNLDFGGMQVKPSTTRRGRNAGASTAEEGGSTKLRKRATMAAAAQAEAEPEPTAGSGGFGGGGDWGSAPSASGGDGGWGNTTSTDGGWGSTAAPAATNNDNSWGAPAPAQSQPPQQAAAPAAAANDFDALFGAPAPNQPSVKPTQQPPLPDASTSAVTDDFIDSVIPPKRASPAPAPAQQQQQQQQPQQQQSTAASPQAAMLQQQQQMLQMLQSQMQQVMTSNADANVKAQQMQALMQQQQQIMSMMQMMNAQQQGQPSQQQQQQLPSQQQQPQYQQQPGAGQFAALNEEMKRSMGY